MGLSIIQAFIWFLGIVALYILDSISYSTQYEILVDQVSISGTASKLYNSNLELMVIWAREVIKSRPRKETNSNPIQSTPLGTE
jgi:hypothetical protein